MTLKKKDRPKKNVKMAGKKSNNSRYISLFGDGTKGLSKSFLDSPTKENNKASIMGNEFAD
jgi:hypothetical protein